MSGDYGAFSGHPVRLGCSDLSVELSATIAADDTVDSVWTTWQARLVCPGEILADELETDAPLPTLEAATAELCSLDFDRLDEADVSLAEALDEYSQDFAEFAVMADGVGLAGDLLDQLVDHVSGMVVVDRVTVPRHLRGRRYGLFLTAVSLLEIARRRVAVALPAAFEVNPSSPERDGADRRNVEMWTAFGFRQYRQEKVYFLDTATVRLQENLRRFRLEIEAAEPILLP